MSAAPISTETIPEAESSISTTTKNKEIVEKLFEDSKNTLKKEHDDMINKIKQDLNKAKQQALTRLKKI